MSLESLVILSPENKDSFSVALLFKYLTDMFYRCKSTFKCRIYKKKHSRWSSFNNYSFENRVMLCCPQRLVVVYFMVYSNASTDVTVTGPRAAGIWCGPRRNSLVNPHYECPKRTGLFLSRGWGGDSDAKECSRCQAVWASKGFVVFSLEERWGHYSKIVLLSALCSGMPCTVKYGLSLVVDGFISPPTNIS